MNDELSIDFFGIIRFSVNFFTNHLMGLLLSVLTFEG